MYACWYDTCTHVPMGAVILIASCVGGLIGYAAHRWMFK